MNLIVWNYDTSILCVPMALSLTVPDDISQGRSEERRICSLVWSLGLLLTQAYT